MSLVERNDRRFFFIVIIFVLINSFNTQTIEQNLPPSNIVLVPSFVVLNSPNTVDFVCINHQLNDSPPIVGLSKNISNDQLKIFRHQLNKTTIRIRLQLRNYIGIFQLYCHAKGQQTKGTRADVIVRAKVGLVQLLKRCQVYNKQYIQCIIRAPTIARAIQNDFPAEFEFKESTNLQSYNTKYEFLKNESTDEYLIFKWTPSVYGVFPDGVIMYMRMKLPYFGTTNYRFDMTPIFLIKPEFVLQKISKNKIQIQLASISPSAICEKSITSKTNFSISQTWTIFESHRKTINTNELLPNTTYQICMRCRQTTNDSDAVEECQNLSIAEKSNSRVPINIIIPIIIVICLITVISFGLIFSCRQNKQRTSNEAAKYREPVRRDLISYKEEEEEEEQEQEQEDEESSEEFSGDAANSAQHPQYLSVYNNTRVGFY